MSKLRLIPSLAFGLVLTSAANPPPPVGAPLAPKCSGGWSGSIQFTRTQAYSHSKSEPVISGKGTESYKTTMNYDYSAQITVSETPERDGNSVAKASVNFVLATSESVTTTDQGICGGDRRLRTMSGASSSKSETRASATGVEADFSVGMGPEGDYSIGIGIPALDSRTTGSRTSAYSGQCTPRQGSNGDMPPSEGRTDRISFSTGYTQQASNLNRLSGSYTNKYGRITETLNWDLRRCGTPP